MPNFRKMQIISTIRFKETWVISWCNYFIVNGPRIVPFQLSSTPEVESPTKTGNCQPEKANQTLNTN